jgi:hypothetical protein
MSNQADHNWWAFAIDPEIRGSAARSRLTGELDINPELPDGRSRLDYHNYLGLDRLLQAQAPGSAIPDERVFVITHQLFELTFKMMIFDFAVLAETFHTLLGLTDETEFLRLATGEGEFWRPALTAAGRLRFESKDLLPTIMKYFRGAEYDTFSSVEYHKFRDNLAPASGFQTAQFRLIQQALGKGHVLSVRLFPSDDYMRNYGGKDAGMVKVVDPVILRQDAAVAQPPADSPLAQVARLDDLAHQVLARLPTLGEDQPLARAVPLISQTEVDDALDALRKILANRRRQQERKGHKPPDADERDAAALALFQHDLEQIVRTENTRRRELAAARAGALYLHYVAPRCALAQALKHLIATDDNLHGRHEGSFLSLHIQVAIDRIREVKEVAQALGEPEAPSGTAGGGIEYLGFVRKHLIELFPAVIAYRDLQVTQDTWSWIE